MKNKILSLFVALVASACLCAQDYVLEVFRPVDWANNNGITSAASDVSAGTTMYNGTNYNVTVPFADQIKTVATGQASHEHIAFLVGNQTINVETGVQGNNNPKDGDASNPCNSLQVPYSGSCFRVFAKQDGKMIVLGKFTSNKQYFVFENGMPIGYSLAMQTYATPSLGTNGLLSYTLVGDQEYNYLNSSILQQNTGFNRIMYVEDYVNDTLTSGVAWENYKKNGVGMMVFDVYAQCTYLVGAGGSKLPASAFIFTGNDRTADLSVVALGETVNDVTYSDVTMLTLPANSTAPVIPEHDYSITLYAPDCGGYTPAVIGDFSNWQQSVPMTAGVDAQGNTVYTATIHAQEGTNFKFRQAGIDNWDNEIYIINQYGNLVANPNLPFTSDTIISIDYSDGTYTLCPPKYTVRFWVYDKNWNQILLEGKLVEEGTTLSVPVWFGYNVTRWYVSNLGYSYDPTSLTSVVVHSDMNIYADEFTREMIDGFCYDFDTDANTAVLAQGAENEYREYDTINIPASITYQGINFTVVGIGQEAFYDCYRLQSVTIPNSVISIGYEAFAYCNNLNTIEVPSSVTTIESDAFRNVYNVAYTGSATGAPWGARYMNLRFEDPFIFNADKTVLMKCTDKSITSVVVPEGVVEISDNAFSDCYYLTSVTLPNSLKKIGKYAFRSCNNLTSVNIPSGVTYIGYQAFAYCYDLISVNIPATTDTIGDEAFASVYNIVYTGAATGAPWGARNMNLIVEDPFILSPDRQVLKKCMPSATGAIEVPTSVKMIAENAFSECYDITSIVVPNSVDTIGEGAFRYCYNLTSLTIPSTTVVMLDEDQGYELFYLKSLTNISAPAAMFFLNQENFSTSYYNEILMAMPQHLQHVVINHDTLDASAFDILRQSRTALQTLDISATVCEELPMEAFNGCIKLETLLLPAGMKKLNYMSVAECLNLRQIAIPASLQEIGDRAFENCRHLTTVTFNGNNLTRIGDWAFFQCLQLQNINIPQGVTQIGDAAFYECAYLANVNLPASVSQIGDYAFANCSRMTRMDVKAAVPPTVNTMTFDEVSRTMPVYVPQNSVNAYKADPIWGQLNIIGESGEQSALDNTDATNAKVRKLFENGHLYILLPDGTRFDATGKKVE